VSADDYSPEKAERYLRAAEDTLRAHREGDPVVGLAIDIRVNDRAVAFVWIQNIGGNGDLADYKAEQWPSRQHAADGEPSERSASIERFERSRGPLVLAREALEALGC